MSNTILRQIAKYFNNNIGRELTKVDTDCDLNHIKANVVAAYKVMLKRSGYIIEIQKGSFHKESVFVVNKTIPENIRMRDLDVKS